MFPSPLQLDRYVVTEFRFTADAEYDYRPDFNGKIELADLTNEVIPHKHKDDPLRWIFSLTIELPEKAEKKYPYSFRIVLVGFFNVSPTYPPEQTEVLVNANAPALLYSAAREFLATVTGRGPFMALWLPTAMFIKPREATQANKGETVMAKPERRAAKKAKKK
jgi:preprotein translocase subunit SecB